MPPMKGSPIGWREALFNRRMLICVFTGFSSGLPLYLLLNLHSSKVENRLFSDSASVG